MFFFSVFYPIIIDKISLKPRDFCDTVDFGFYDLKTVQEICICIFKCITIKIESACVRAVVLFSSSWLPDSFQKEFFGTVNKKHFLAGTFFRAAVLGRSCASFFNCLIGVDPTLLQKFRRRSE